MANGNKGKGGKETLRVINIETGKPRAREGRVILFNQLRQARAAGQMQVKIIHGYGSSGPGGSLKTMCHALLAEQAARGLVRVWVPGERWDIFDADCRQALDLCPELSRDPDLGRKNYGVTLAILGAERPL